MGAACCVSCGMPPCLFTRLHALLMILALAWMPLLARGATQEAVLEDLTERSFLWFWDTVNPVNGLSPDRGPPPSASSIAAQGFALTAYPIGIERGYITREQGAQRVLLALKFLRDLPQGAGTAGIAGYRGFFYHFLNLNTGLRDGTTELSSVDTAWLMMGVLFCQSYFDGEGDAEPRIRSLAEELYGRVEWDWMVQRAPLLCMGWHPESGFLGYDWSGYNEGLGLYVLALGSPTHPVDPAAWTRLCSTFNWRSYQGQEHVNFGPLFGHQFSQAWIDFRGIQDAYMRGKGIDYFENSRRATLAQRAYALANPDGWSGYGETLWGLSACDGPGAFTLQLGGRVRQFYSYNARGAAGDYLVDDGTLAPCASIASLPFAPELVLPVIEALLAAFGGALLDEHGFLDAFNPTLTSASAPVTQGRVIPGVGWVDTQHLGIDQGPILLMLENHRTGFVWSVLQRNPHIVDGLLRAGFTGGWLEAPPRIEVPPAHAGADQGGAFTLQARVSGLGPLEYQWFKDGVAVAGARSRSLTVAAATPADSGGYSVQVSNPKGATLSPAALVRVYTAPARLVNLSARGLVGTGGSQLIAGCSVEGQGSKQVLVRAVGPALAAFGLPLSTLVADPLLSVMPPVGSALAGDDDWDLQPAASEVLAAFAQVGAFALPTRGKDAALLLAAPAGQTFTALAAPKGMAAGLGLVEIYAMADSPSPRLVNLSTRGLVGSGASGLFLGFYLGDGGSRRLLIRAVGPGLARVAPDLKPLLPSPLLIVRRSSDGTELARNAGWELGGQGPAIAAASSQVGAFALEPGSADAALILHVPAATPGANDRGFTIQSSDSGAESGLAIAEIYELP